MNDLILLLRNCNPQWRCRHNIDAPRPRPAHKTCSRCGENKPVGEFYSRGDRDAPKSECKVCSRMRAATTAKRVAQKTREAA